MSLLHEKRAAPVKATLLPAERYGHRQNITPVESNNTRSEDEFWGWALFLSFELSKLSAGVFDNVHA